MTRRSTSHCGLFWPLLDRRLGPRLLFLLVSGLLSCQPYCQPNLLQGASFLLGSAYICTPKPQ